MGDADAAERSWVPGADGSGFGIEHLPYGAVRRPGGELRPAARIGDRALDLALLSEEGLLGADRVPPGSPPLDGVFERPTLNALLELGPPAWAALRRRLIELLRAGD